MADLPINSKPVPNFYRQLATTDTGGRGVGLEAEFLDDIGTKILKPFLHAIHSHLY